MNLADPILELLAYEVAIIFAVIAASLLFHSRKKSRQLENDTAAAVKKIKQNKDHRANQIKAILSEKYNRNGAALDAAVNDFSERERLLYKGLLKLFVEQDGKTLAELPQKIEAAIDASLGLLPVGTPQPESQNQSDNNGDSLSLQQQIDQTAETMERLLAQYHQSQNPAPAPDDTDEETLSVTEAEADVPDEPQSADDTVFSDASLLDDYENSVEEAKPETDIDASEDDISAEGSEAETVEQIFDDNSFDIEPDAEPERLDTDDIEALLDGANIDLETQQSEMDERPIETETDSASEAPDVKKPEAGTQDESVAEITEIEGNSEQLFSFEQTTQLDDKTEQKTLNDDDSDTAGEITEIDGELAPSEPIEPVIPFDEDLQRFVSNGDEIEIPGQLSDIEADLQQAERIEIAEEQIAEDEAEIPAEPGPSNSLKDYLKKDVFTIDSSIYGKQAATDLTATEPEISAETTANQPTESFAIPAEASIAAEADSPLTADIDELIDNFSEQQAVVSEADQNEQVALSDEHDTEQQIESVQLEVTDSDKKDLAQNKPVNNTIAEPEPEPYQTEAERLQLLMTAAESDSFDEDAELAGQQLPAEDLDSGEKPRFNSELEELRAKLRARTATLKAQAEARQQHKHSLHDDETSDAETPSEPEATEDMVLPAETFAETVEDLTSETTELQVSDEQTVPAFEPDQAEQALMDAWQQQLAAEQSELVNDEPVPEQETESEPELDIESANEVTAEPQADEFAQEEIDTGPPVHLTDAKAAVSEMWQDLTEEPLPSEDELEAMFNEIRQLDQPQSESVRPNTESDATPRNNGELQSILSSIPSFSAMNKNKEE